MLENYTRKLFQRGTEMADEKKSNFSWY
jgi:hypothetical protein